VGNAASGVEVQGVNNTLGGTSYFARNYISGNTGAGVLLDSAASGTLLEGNRIGVDFTGKIALGNGSYGVSIGSSNNTIGGTVAGAGNTIADNAAGGVLLSAGSGNTLRRNVLFANGATQTGPGIVLAAGANNNLAAPTLTSASYNSTTQTLTVQGTITAPTANVTYVLEFYANPTGDPEGQIFLGTKLVKATKTGTIAFTFTATTTVTTSDPLVTATLTDASGDTSAFSNGVTTS
jgi:parallel beta-helix repeat protein